MRPKGKGELESLYFKYPHFDPPQRSASLTQPVKVAIVGAGPVGMVAALTLARHGIASVLLESKSTFNDGSRAICLARQSLHILECLDVAEPFVAKALHYLSGRTFFRGKEILEFFMADGDHEKHRPMYNLEQQYIEEFLHRGVERSELIDMRWQSHVTALRNLEEGIRLTVEDPNGTYQLDTSWLLAADGARSSIRSMRGLRLKGENYEGRYVIADIRMRYDHKVERFALFDPASRRGGTVLVHQQPDDIWRIDYQLRDGESEEEALKEEAIREGVAGVLGDIGFDAPWELEWWSIYSANTLLLDDYRDGRVFFIGDSAHVVPIFGVRGLNNGIADAQNIGWKLACVLDGHADAALLDSYTPERRGATLEVFANASKSARFMTPPTRGWSLMRDAALLLALKHPFAGAFANPRNMTPYTYASGPITQSDEVGFARGPIPGEVAHSVKLADGSFLLDHFGYGFNVLAFGDGRQFEGQFEGLSDLAPGLRVIELPPDGAVATAYGAAEGTVYMIRPDQHVSARWKKVDTGAVVAHLSALLAGRKAA